MEPAALDLSLYKAALIVLGAAAVVIPLFHRLRVSSVLGFMLVGIVVGPFGLTSLVPGLPWLSAISIGDPESIEPIARLGVVLLLFMIGLELSVERLIVMRQLVFGLGCLQVVLCGGALAGAAMLLGYGWIGAAVVGVALAMSSTAVVIQVLSEEKRLNTTTGRTSFAVLLFQDLAVVPLLFVLGALDPTNSAGGWAGFGVAAAQALIAVAALVALGRLALRPLFRGVARTHSPELFVAACLLVVIAAGLATAAAGLSMALGALIGGLLLAGTEYRRQVEVTIDPFKGLFVASPPVAVDLSLLAPESPDAPPRVIIAGFGRVGQTVIGMLDTHEVPYVAVDRDPDRVARQRAQGKPVYFGDMTRIELLRRLHLDTARALVVTLDDTAAADELVAGARAERPDLLIVAPARDASHAAHLYRTGASQAVAETIEASLQLSEAVLVDVGVPMGPVIASIHERRDAIQASIKAMAPAAEVRILGRRRMRDER